jgi:manganese/iron transport system ATP-binding protein
MALLDKLRKTNLGFLVRPHPHEAGKPILRTENLCVEYDSGPALIDLTFELRRGERMALVGPNGAGKSTLFKVIAGIIPPTDGLVEVAGHEPDGHICIAYLPQRSQVDWSFPVTVSDVVMMGRVGKMGFVRWPTARDRQLVHQALETVRMTEYAGRQISQLSGGQQQRMFIARALAQEAELVLMDEPLTGLDLVSHDDIFSILNSLGEQGVTVIVALHDLKIAAERFDRVMLLNRELVGLGTPEAVFQPEQLLIAYGGHLRLVNTENGVLVLSDSCCGEGIDERI